MKAIENNQLSLLDSFMPITPHNEFLTKICQLIDFNSFKQSLDACYSEIGRPACDPIILFKMLLLQRWYNLSDKQVIEQSGDRITFRKFLGIGFSEQLPDDTTLVRFRNRLDEHRLYDKLIAVFERQLEKHNVRVNEGRITIVDATIIPSNTRQKHNDPSHVARVDPGAQTTYHPKKGPITGFKMHMQMDADSRLIEKFRVTGAAVADTNYFFVSERAKIVLADKGYDSEYNRLKLKVKGVCDGIMRRSRRSHSLSYDDKIRNKLISPFRSKIESKFGEMKKWVGLSRAIYRGLDRVRRQVCLTVLAVNMKRITVLVRA